MADKTVTVTGLHQKSSTGGTADRKDIRQSLSKMPKIGIPIVLVLFAITFGNDLATWFRSDGPRNPPAVNVPGPGTTRSGTVSAPANSWSSWLNVMDNECVYWQGVDPTGNRFKVQYVNPAGDIALYNGTPLTEMRGIRFRSTTGADEQVSYRIVLKQNGRC